MAVLGHCGRCGLPYSGYGDRCRCEPLPQAGTRVMVSERLAGIRDEDIVQMIESGQALERADTHEDNRRRLAAEEINKAYRMTHRHDPPPFNALEHFGQEDGYERFAREYRARGRGEE